MMNPSLTKIKASEMNEELYGTQTKYNYCGRSGLVTITLLINRNYFIPRTHPLTTWEPKILTKRKCFNLNYIKCKAKPCILHHLLIVATFPSPVEEKCSPHSHDYRLDCKPITQRKTLLAFPPNYDPVLRRWF